MISYLQLNPSAQNNQTLKDHIRRAIELSNVLPYLLETLILTGMFKHCDYIRFKKFVYSKYPPALVGSADSPNTDIETVYFENGLKAVEAKISSKFPMSLKALCRLQVNQSMKEFVPRAVEKLNIPKSTKAYLMYDTEIDEFFLSQAKSAASLKQ